MLDSLLNLQFNMQNSKDRANIIQFLHIGSSNTKNLIWETYCNTLENSKPLLKKLEVSTISILLQDPSFKYRNIVAEYLIEARLRDKLVSYALSVGDSHDINTCDVQIANYLWNNLHFAIGLYTIPYDGGIDYHVDCCDGILSYMEQHMPFEKWLDTQPSIAKLKKIVKCYIDFQPFQELKADMLKQLIKHPHTAYIANNIQALALLDINETSNNYWPLIFNKTVTKKIDPAILESITF